MKEKTSIFRWMRILHRDIGFFVIGLTVIYCVSGILLTFRTTNFLKSERQIEKSLSPGMSANTLSRALHLRGIRVVNESEEEIVFENGTYNKTNGKVSYTSNEWPMILQQFNSLHVASNADPRSPFTVLYAICLFFLAISSFWMYRPGNKYFKRGIITAAGGIVAAIILIAI